MSENPYTRTISIEIVELVPERDRLPYCRAWKHDGQQCANRARFSQDGKPACGQHVGRPSLLWMPEKWAER